MDEMQVEIHSEDEEGEEVKTENPTEAIEPDADTTQELTAEVIANQSEDCTAQSQIQRQVEYLQYRSNMKMGRKSGT